AVDLHDVIERAYGILWRDMQSSEFSNAARQVLLEALSKDGIHRAVQYACRRFDGVTDAEVMAAFGDVLDSEDELD
ncbi:MAG: hypothetical protein ACFBZ9_01260, partial [Sphingomonadales bacterium]